MPIHPPTAARFASALSHYRSARRCAHTAPEVEAYHVALEAALAEVHRLAGLILATPARISPLRSGRRPPRWLWSSGAISTTGWSWTPSGRRRCAACWPILRSEGEGEIVPLGKPLGKPNVSPSYYSYFNYLGEKCKAHPLRHLHIANPKTGPSRGLFLYVSKGPKGLKNFTTGM